MQITLISGKRIKNLRVAPSKRPNKPKPKEDLMQILTVSPITNEINLATVNRRNPRVLNDKKTIMTNQAINAVIQHIKGQGNHIETEFGKLIWEPREG
jgi:hypothetical protein